MPSAPGLLLLATALAQAASDAPSFPSEASAITVDVVVLDDDGHPVRGLTRDDFTVREDGREQTLVGFEARDLDVPGDTTAETFDSALSQVTSDNSGSDARPGRVFALLIDDLGISPPVATQIKPALAGWIRDQAGPRDEITIMTTSGDLWWSDVVSRGRSDLLTVLGRVEGKRLEDSQRSENLSEWEAYRILFVEDGMGPERLGDTNVSAGGIPQSSDTPRLAGNSVTERVVQRFFDAGLCHCVPFDCNIPRCLGLVRQSAGAVHETWRRRAESVYGAIGRLSRSLEGVRGRKSILFVSEEFIQDPSVDRPFREAIDASQKANTAIYFLGARGLTGLSSFSVAQGGPEGSLTRIGPRRDQDMGMLAAEAGVLATGGAENLADATGGALTVSNDLAAGLERLALDSTAYYLLGYQPESPPDGKWHDLQVDVTRPDMKVLARRGYVAARPEDLA
ncbi:MAG: VWA domain-containing protein, partial [Acidobacteria bacterium]|nr:VWA domain-containing protein [Acidobacteriota bacterium]